MSGVTELLAIPPLIPVVAANVKQATNLTYVDAKDTAKFSCREIGRKCHATHSRQVFLRECCCKTSASILSACHRFQVVGINASGLSTEMVKVHTFWNGSAQKLKEYAMCVASRTSKAFHSIAFVVPVHIPYPARRFMATIFNGVLGRLEDFFVGQKRWASMVAQKSNRFALDLILASVGFSRNGCLAAASTPTIPVRNHGVSCPPCAIRGRVLRYIVHTLRSLHERRAPADWHPATGRFYCPDYTTRTCHLAYDAHELDILALLTIDEQLNAVDAAGGIYRAYHRLTGRRPE